MGLLKPDSISAKGLFGSAGVVGFMLGAAKLNGIELAIIGSGFTLLL